MPPDSAKKSGTPERLSVKELAESLQVSVRFVYQMRARGFPMHGCLRNNRTATLQEAQDWIKANDFRLVNGLGVIGNEKYGLLDQWIHKPAD